MKLMQFERVNSELKQSFYEQNKSSGISINTENVFRLKQCILRFQNEKAYSGNYARDGGFKKAKPGGLFGKVTREGVSAIQGR